MPLLWISLFFLAGLVLGKYLPIPVPLSLALAGACLLALPLFRRLPDRPGLLGLLRASVLRHDFLRLPPILLAVMLFFGAARMASSGPDVENGHIAAYNDRGAFRIQAVVTGHPDRRDKSTLLRLSVEQVAELTTGKTHPAHGFMLALLPGQSGFQYGDRLVLEGKPATPPEDEEFSYRDYLARQEVYTYITYPRVRRIAQDAGSPVMAAIYRFRDWAYEEIYHLFPAPEAPLLAGILLGIETDMSPALTRAFQDTGTAHIIAISGFNMAILAGLFSALFGRITSRWWALILSIVAIGTYTLLVGASPSVVRAAIMGGLSLLAHQIGRKSAGPNTLLLTAAAMSLHNPHMPWDASFQLSFGATAGLIWYGDRFTKGFLALLERKFTHETASRINGPISEYILLTLAAQLMTMPVILYLFQRLSISSFLANPLILPPQPLVMVLGGLAVLAGLVSDPLAHAMAWLAWPFPAYTIRMVELLAQIPNGVLALDRLDMGTVILMYALILAPLLPKAGGKLYTTVRSMFQPTVLALGSFLLAALLLRGAFTTPDGRLHLHIYEMEGSQVLLIRGPGGARVLVDSGPSARLLNDMLGRWVSPLDRRLDGILLNSEGASSMKSLTSVLERYPTAQAWWGIQPPNHRTAERLVEYLDEAEIPQHILVTGEQIDLGSGVRLRVLATGKTGSALLLTWDRFRLLIPSGNSPSSLPAEETRGLSAIILTSRDLEKTSPEAWQALAPQVIVVTPEQGAVPVEGVNWLETNATRWYLIRSDGVQMWVERNR